MFHGLFGVAQWERQGNGRWVLLASSLLASDWPRNLLRERFCNRFRCRFSVIRNFSLLAEMCEREAQRGARDLDQPPERRVHLQNQEDCARN